MPKPFVKDDPRINRKGRPKVPSKSNTELRQMIRDFVSGLFDPEDMLKDFNSLKADQKFKVRIDLSKMLLPDPISLQRMTPEEMSELYQFIKEQLQDESKNVGVN